MKPAKPDKDLYVDFNADIGESFAGYKMGMDEEILPHITSANIATGFHAGDPDWMAYTVSMAENRNVAIGAHPAYPDLQGFGRRDMSLEPSEIRHIMLYQMGALSGFTKDRKLQHVKPHGALYNRAAKDPHVAESVVDAIKEFDPSVVHVVLSGSLWEEVAREKGVPTARECFVDRAVTSDGQLVPRSQPGAIIHQAEQVIARALQIVTEHRVQAVDGYFVKMEADTLCLHGDTAGAVNLAKRVREALETYGVNVVSMSEIVI